MKALFVLACLLATTVPFEAGSSSESKERRYFRRSCPPCPELPNYPPNYPPFGQPPFIWPYYPPGPGAPADQPPAFWPFYPPGPFPIPPPSD
ncbi:PREDICTED: U1 small nuclear ribonucleoprotein C-like [Gekko japonicus]|uniref:U1 small nuclear ribonucleoprotein C-like n=1 Tax=Gekko japonicus TaxID=146911 RepID=A0ABM1KT64_GEKJA|nr:PREDICTED: U1 small nuclear ribonucleoprotein C-like [Gekko japonicus]